MGAATAGKEEEERSCAREEVGGVPPRPRGRRRGVPPRPAGKRSGLGRRGRWRRGAGGAEWQRRERPGGRKRKEGGGSDMWAPHIRSTSTSSQFDTLTV